MPVDMQLTEDRDITLDPTGDIALVSGQDNVEQQHANAVFRAIDLTERAFPQSVYESNLRSNIKTELLSLQYVTKVYPMDISFSDAGVTVSVRTDSADIEVSE